ncbi:MAG: PepSY domain-containing protein [Opitutus sp.]|nr:PepSY domain-containing protein [Opitutus sp.]
MKVRKTFLWLHRWTGVLAGLAILALAITGGALVFEQAISRWLLPDLFPQESTPKEKRAPITAALERLRVLHPESRVQGIRLPRDERDALVLFSGNRAVHFDPGTGELLGSRPRMGSWEQTMIKLHVKLLSGETGATIVVVATGFTLGLALSGLWLWWPWRITWFSKGAAGRRFHFDLHSIAGLYSSLFLLVIGGSGLTLRYLHGEHPTAPPVSASQANGPRLSVDEAIRRAEAALPGARAAAVEMPPPNPRAAFRIQLSFPEDGSPAGRSVVFLDQFSGDVLAVHSSRVGSVLEKYQMAQLSIHTGAVGGTFTRVIAFLTCVALVLQVVSGYLIWWKRPKA